MKKSLLILLAVALLAGCKKDPKIQTLSLVSTNWQSYYFTASGGEKFYKIIKFTNSTELSYSLNYPYPGGFLTGSGDSKLSYSIDDPTKEFPTITVTGRLNSNSGVSNAGDPVNWKLNYVREMSSSAASMSVGTDYYMKY